MAECPFRFSKASLDDNKVREMVSNATKSRLKIDSTAMEILSFMSGKRVMRAQRKAVFGTFLNTIYICLEDHYESRR
jgi:hypothetical protein